MNIRHFGIRTKKFKESMKFYKKLGFKVVYNKTEDWNGIDDFIGKIKVVKMELNGTIFELTETYECESDPFWTHDLYYACHMAIGVDDIEKILTKLKKDIEFVLSPDKSVRVAFIEDPNGLEIELVEKI